METEGRPVTSPRKRIALFGGSFNPPHVGHVLASLYVLATMPIDELWVIPTYAHPFEKALAEFADRFAMCVRAFDRVKGCRVLDVEAQLPSPSRTLQTVTHLQTQFPDASFSWVVGTDVWAERNLWYGYDRLEKMVTFIVLGRHGYADPETPQAMLPDVSSSRVRAGLLRRREAPAAKQLAAWVPATVLAYIEEKGLYW